MTDLESHKTATTKLIPLQEARVVETDPAFVGLRFADFVESEEC